MAEGNNSDLTTETNQEEPVISKKRKRALDKKQAITRKSHAPLKELRMTGRGMKSLDHFPKLLELEELDLSDNALENGLEALIDSTPKIAILDLTGNKFSDIESLKPLEKLENLVNLSVFDCPLTTNESYRSQIYELLPNLVVLDGFDKNNEQIKSGEKKTEISGPSNSQGNKKTESSSEDENETKIYKDFLQDQIKCGEDESSDDEFVPKKDLSNNTENASESTSERETDADDDQYSEVNTSNETSNSEQNSQKELSSSPDNELTEPKVKRIRTENTSNDD